MLDFTTYFNTLYERECQRRKSFTERIFVHLPKSFLPELKQNPPPIRLPKEFDNYPVKMDLSDKENTKQREIMLRYLCKMNSFNNNFKRIHL